MEPRVKFITILSGGVASTPAPPPGPPNPTMTIDRTDITIDQADITIDQTEE